jgi:hypothetical protein
VVGEEEEEREEQAGEAISKLCANPAGLGAVPMTLVRRTTSEDGPGERHAFCARRESTEVSGRLLTEEASKVTGHY